ncbi:MAG: rRNA (uracil1498-N3)-methyltransferase [Candidatus Atribacteria bacterium]|nr:rRNA (uracil1498-N3)-methyltransferase [Candidatus Atribacteria bacterium]
MSRFFFYPKLEEGRVVVLGRKESRHLLVERVGLGEEIQLSDGRGNLYAGEVLAWLGGRVQVKVERWLNQGQPFFRLGVFQSLLKSPKRMDWLVEKLTEIGVTELNFFPSERSVKEAVSTAKKKRWENIVESACKQSGRAFFPELQVWNSWEEVLSSIRTRSGLVILADLQAEKLAFDFFREANTFEECYLLVGPEGDFTSREKEALSFIPQVVPLRLSPYVLRSETAAFLGSCLVSSFLWSSQESNNDEGCN